MSDEIEGGTASVNAVLPPWENADIFLIADLSDTWKNIINQMPSNTEFQIDYLDSNNYVLLVNDETYPTSLTDDDCSIFRTIVDETMTTVPANSLIERYTFRFKIV